MNKWFRADNDRWGSSVQCIFLFLLYLSPSIFFIYYTTISLWGKGFPLFLQIIFLTRLFSAPTSCTFLKEKKFSLLTRQRRREFRQILHVAANSLWNSIPYHILHYSISGLCLSVGLFTCVNACYASTCVCVCLRMCACLCMCVCIRVYVCTCRWYMPMYACVCFLYMWGCMWVCACVW